MKEELKKQVNDEKIKKEYGDVSKQILKRISDNKKDTLNKNN